MLNTLTQCLKALIIGYNLIGLEAIAVSQAVIHVMLYYAMLTNRPINRQMIYEIASNERLFGSLFAAFADRCN